jgi:diaminohydroxyphosphoribosylaminopyrimidine deaminase/5-amino-6-(5-phosphoribosylamino)uracil reductase
VSAYGAGLLLGADSRSAVGALGLGRLDFAPRLTLVSTYAVGADTVATWRREA